MSPPRHNPGGLTGFHQCSWCRRKCEQSHLLGQLSMVGGYKLETWINYIWGMALSDHFTQRRRAIGESQKGVGLRWSAFCFRNMGQPTLQTLRLHCAEAKWQFVESGIMHEVQDPCHKLTLHMQESSVYNITLVDTFPCFCAVLCISL